MDIIQEGLKWLGHNRYLAFAVAASGSGLGLASCAAYDGKVYDPATGEIADADGLSASYNKALTTLEQQYHAEQAIVTAALTRMDAISDSAINLEDDYDIAFTSANNEIIARNEIFGQITAAVEGFLPASALPVFSTAVPIASGLIAGGAVIDNRRKNRIIKKTNGHAVTT